MLFPNEGAEACLDVFAGGRRDVEEENPRAPFAMAFLTMLLMGRWLGRAACFALGISPARSCNVFRCLSGWGSGTAVVSTLVVAFSLRLLRPEGLCLMLLVTGGPIAPRALAADSFNSLRPAFLVGEAGSCILLGGRKPDDLTGPCEGGRISVE